MAKQQMASVTKFLGLNEAADGLRELALGQAAEATNWRVTDGNNITLRPGFTRAFAQLGQPAALWSGYIKDKDYLIACFQHPEDAVTDVVAFTHDGEDFIQLGSKPVYHEYGATTVKLFPMFANVYLSVGSQLWTVEFDDELHLEKESPYVPLVVTGASPAGGGTNLEQLNILSDNARVQYSADGTSTEFVPPTNATGITHITVDNAPAEATFDKGTKKVAFAEAPVQGVNNVEITYLLDGSLADARTKFANMPFVEAYNGPTDSRLFFYGDGSNVAYYTGVPMDMARGSVLYLPAANEISVDMSDSPITAATRHYNKLLFYKPDCTAIVTYEPTTLADGSTIAGFTMKTISKTVGNEPYGQVKLVKNSPRSISDGNLYEWKMVSVTATDERNASDISDPICKSLGRADMSRIVTCNDASDSTYYIFLNDDKGTVLANRYELGTWTSYQSQLTMNVRHAVVYNDTVVFLAENNGTTSMCYFDLGSRYDSPLVEGEEKQQVKALWKTGYQDFKAEYLKKYTTLIWVSILPEYSSKCEITATTDRRDTYTVKDVSANIFNYGKINYVHWTYNGNHSPVVRRVKLKVKKFTFYQLQFVIDEPGATATILGYDQKIRYGSEVK